MGTAAPGWQWAAAASLSAALAQHRPGFGARRRQKMVLYGPHLPGERREPRKPCDSPQLQYSARLRGPCLLADLAGAAPHPTAVPAGTSDGPQGVRVMMVTPARPPEQHPATTSLRGRGVCRWRTAAPPRCLQVPPLSVSISNGSVDVKQKRRHGHKISECSWDPGWRGKAWRHVPWGRSCPPGGGGAVSWLEGHLR